MRRVQGEEGSGCRALSGCAEEGNNGRDRWPSPGNCKRIDKGAEASLGAMRLCQERWDRNVAEAFRKCFPSEDPLGQVSHLVQGAPAPHAVLQVGQDLDPSLLLRRQERRCARHGHLHPLVLLTLHTIPSLPLLPPPPPSSSPSSPCRFPTPWPPCSRCAPNKPCP